MTNNAIFELLEKVRMGETSTEEAFERLKDMPFEDLSHTKVDHHRMIRKGLPEVVFGEGKSVGRIGDIIRAMRGKNLDVLVTRLPKEAGEEIAALFPSGVYSPEARSFYIKEDRAIKGKGTILIVSAGTSDIPVAEEAYIASTFFGNRTERLYDVGIAGIHRLIQSLSVIREARVVIVVAGMEGALPSIVAGMVGVPVIGVPTSIGYGASFGGLTALLAMLNSCSTVSVFNIDNGFGAAYFATLINRL
ncbi:nickel pincer cofactor biosynthesis protein LarB [Syntrophorhabdus aromaticivorans]|mgnify:CR=1 FL=1|uniref:Nickel pincer cofactor biosynthesis protein LarB n=1 Tax=Syntrophorhabdus aromaticivorans TaxID=328301 RepID=A0A351U3P0_9BACT|nr:nickel pincer cofactor biosynthesis protein LarB [Syntrophorhabdus aromaticivorans]NLW34056.1 nickel pincer cofactor biosynthesis protein LarB [Syntrophorhabdus aromaticivorans]HBA54571.1 nickel pincer cofactor biosynthesis protein LarB [Syntrophorhabdus aromaticivorans]